MLSRISSHFAKKMQNKRGAATGRNRIFNLEKLTCLPSFFIAFPAARSYCKSGKGDSGGVSGKKQNEKTPQHDNDNKKDQGGKSSQKEKIKGTGAEQMEGYGGYKEKNESNQSANKK